MFDVDSDDADEGLPWESYSNFEEVLDVGSIAQLAVFASLVSLLFCILFAFLSKGVVEEFGFCIGVVDDMWISSPSS